MKITPSLYIGLGETGIQAISRTKKMFEDEFGKGNIPPCVQFLAIDLDRSVLEASYLETDMHDDYVHLHCAEPPLKNLMWMFPSNATRMATERTRSITRSSPPSLQEQSSMNCPR